MEKLGSKVFKNECYILEPTLKTTDYLWFVTKSSTVEQRRKFDIGDIFINAAVCRKCGDYIRSMNRRDFKNCSCGAVAVDGGSWYARRLGKEKDYYNIIENFYE